ncbi:MAG: hypothetical protein IKM84_05945 [Oscillospiraceae bacterium]|nr:hypothetical protein [Oscillospiraceae bacterium]
MPRFLTIRQIAATGILTENRLRVMQKQGLLPGIMAGRRFLVNLEALTEQLDDLSRQSVRGAKP